MSSLPWWEGARGRGNLVPLNTTKGRDGERVGFYEGVGPVLT